MKHHAKITATCAAVLGLVLSSGVSAHATEPTRNARTNTSTGENRQIGSCVVTRSGNSCSTFEAATMTVFVGASPEAVARQLGASASASALLQSGDVESADVESADDGITTGILRVSVPADAIVCG